MFRYTIIDVGNELVVFNKNDGALAHDRRDSWPPKFPTEEELKYDRKRLKSERLQRQARLEDDLRKKRLQTVCAADFTRDKVGEEEEDEGEGSSDDSGIVSFRDDDHPASNMPTPAAQQTDEQTDNLLQTDTPEQTPAAPGTEVTEVEKDEEENVSPEIRPALETTNSIRSRTVSIRSLSHGVVIADNVLEGPGDKPFIVAPGRRRQPKQQKGKKESAACCAIL